jgi:hypothetical protein
MLKFIKYNHLISLNILKITLIKYNKKIKTKIYEMLLCQISYMHISTKIILKNIIVVGTEHI